MLSKGQPDEFFKTITAARIGDNLLLYQHYTGGWPKNVDMAKRLNEVERRRVIEQKKDSDESTIDNNATTREMIFLARLYNATGAEKYRVGAEKGLAYILEAQYDNGGWPQFYPRDYGYYTHITYNDDAMINVMNVLRDVADGKEPFAFLEDSVKLKAKAAIDKGVDCILRTQVRQNGKLTVWCAQHDEKTLEPAPARSYELISLSGAESANIALFLMSLPNPSAEVKSAIRGAAEWFRTSMITNLKRERFVNDEGQRDYRMVPVAAGEAPVDTLWARFYTIEDNRPFFSDRDGVMKYDLSEIGHERRNGYSWYGKGGLAVLKRYDEWVKEYGEK